MSVGVGGGEGDCRWVGHAGRAGTALPQGEQQEPSLEKQWGRQLGHPAPDPGEDGTLPQLASSLLSWQSLSPSQMKAGLVQMPVEHWNCPGRHLNSAAGKGRSASGWWGWGGRRPLGPRASGGPDVRPSRHPARALTTVRGLVRVVPAVVLRVTLPPEGDALVVLADKLEGRRGREGLVGVWGTQEVCF